ncbi:MAG: nuclear transport factor 2 family protein [Roseiflexaceae bacterium]
MSEHHNRAVVERLWQLFDARDFEAAGALLHDDFVCEWPQTRERIRGRENYRAMNQNYPGTWSVSIRRLIAEGDQVASEVVLTYGEEFVLAVSFFELRDGKIVRQVDYWPEPYPAPVGRAQWVDPM